jgi:hypothetical protein
MQSDVDYLNYLYTLDDLPKWTNYLQLGGIQMTDM